MSETKQDFIYQHNVYLQPMGDKVIVTTIIDKSAFDGVELLNQNFVVAVTKKDELTGNHTMILETTKIIDADEWCKKYDGRSSKGRGIDGMLTSAVWFCKKLPNALKAFFS